MKQKYFLAGLMSLVLMPVVAVALSAVFHEYDVHELKVFGDLPSFSLTERAGTAVDKDSLRGKVWVASFIYTHCSGQCPMICNQMKKIQKKLRFNEKFRMVSISVDPEHDTPEELKKYAVRFDADPFKWLFLTGEKSEILRLMQNGFRLASADGNEPVPGQILHSDKLVLVDSFGRIRGYYDAMDDASLKLLIRDSRGLIRKAF